MKLPISGHREFIGVLSEAFVVIHNDETLRRRLAIGALNCVRKFSWEEKAKSLDDIYYRKVKQAIAAKT
jgi:hypothetical protein